MIELDLGLTLVIGCVRDGVPTAGYEAIDGEDARAWFARHGAAPTSVDSTPIRALYDLYLAYEGGDQARPAIAAGVAIHAVLRLALGYKGAVVYEMRAGMGEVVIAPVYETLAARGVKFAFFHRVERLELSADRSKVRTDPHRSPGRAGGRARRPAIGPSSRSTACRAGRARRSSIRSSTGRPSATSISSRAGTGGTTSTIPVLEAGHDFDVAVLGISLGALDELCADFRADDRWRDMLDHIGTTQSGSAQLWMDTTLEELGWTLGAVPADAAPEPLDVWADRTELLPLEHWPAPAPTLAPVPVRRDPGEDYLRPPTDTGVPAAALAQVTKITSDWLSSAGIALWPGARSADGGFDWSQLHDPAGGTGLARLSSQYLRANIDPSERYVLSLPGTVQYRMAADGSGYDNLILAGDWTKTDWNVGCIEAAVTSGINAAAAVEGEPGSQAS